MRDHVIDINDTPIIPKKVLQEPNATRSFAPFTKLAAIFTRKGKVKSASSSTDSIPRVTLRKEAPHDEASKVKHASSSDTNPVERASQGTVNLGIVAERKKFFEAKKGEKSMKNASSSAADIKPLGPDDEASKRKETSPPVLVGSPSKETVNMQATDDDDASKHRSSDGPDIDKEKENEAPVSSSEVLKTMHLILDEVRRIRKQNQKRGKAKKQKKPTFWEPTSAGISMKGLYAMVSVMINTLLITAGITPPKLADSWGWKKLYQVSEFVGSLSAGVSLLLLLLVNPLSSYMQNRTLNVVNCLMAVGFLALLVVFSSAVLLVSEDAVAYTVGGCCLGLGLLAVLYCLSDTVRGLLCKVKIDLVGTVEDKDANGTSAKDANGTSAKDAYGTSAKDAFKVRTQTGIHRSDVYVSDVSSDISSDKDST